MVAETGLKWHDDGQPAVFQVNIMYKVAVVLLVLLLFLYPCALRAQTTNASITGRVTDPSKATIADAKIAAINLGTKFRYESATNGADEILQKKHMDGWKHMKEAKNMPTVLLANYPDVTDAYIALSIANYVIGSQSAGSRFALWFDGIHGNKRLGMEQVARAAENGRYLRHFAKIILALAACRENQAALARKLSRELSEQYPDSELFASGYAKASSLPVAADLVR